VFVSLQNRKQKGKKIRRKQLLFFNGRGRSGLEKYRKRGNGVPRKAANCQEGKASYKVQTGRK
jgi:hypothetical protein